MAAGLKHAVRIALDTNVLLNLAEGLEAVHDSLQTVMARIQDAQLVVTPTVLIELEHLADNDPDPKKRALAVKALEESLCAHRILPVNLVEVGHGIAEQIALRLQRQGLLPDEETHDALILAEAALLDARLLLTSDVHLRGIDFQRLTLELQSCDVGVPVIATPHEIVRKFCRA